MPASLTGGILFFQKAVEGIAGDEDLPTDPDRGQFSPFHSVVDKGSSYLGKATSEFSDRQPVYLSRIFHYIFSFTLSSLPVLTRVFSMMG